MHISEVFSQDSMIYGIDVNALTRPNYTGVERYVFELISEMMKNPLKEGERVFLYTSDNIDALGELPAGWEFKVLKLSILSKGWTHLRLSWELLINPPDVFFSPAHEIPLGIRRTQIVNTIHDIAFVYVPEVYTFFNLLRQRFAIRLAVMRADRILTVSKTTRNDLEKYYQVPSNRMVVTRLGIRSEDFQTDDHQVNQILSKYSLKPQNYILTIGRIEKKKGIGFLVQVFDEYMGQNPNSDMHLVLGGKMGNGQGEIQSQIENSKFKDQIHVLGFVPEEDLAPLMKGSLVYAFPSTYEGFGIPALEAMASGTPVIISNISALKEVCADAVLIRSTDNIDSWVNAIHRVQNQDIRLNLIKKGFDRVKEFNWEDTAKKTWEVLRSV